MPWTHTGEKRIRQNLVDHRIGSWQATIGVFQRALLLKFIEMKMDHYSMSRGEDSMSARPAESRSNGYAEGQLHGYDRGWNDAIDRANIEMSKQKGFTIKHATEKADLAKQLEQARDEINQLAEERQRPDADLVWQNNRTMVLMNAMRTVLEDLLDDTETRDKVQHLFARRYGEKMQKALDEHKLLVPLDEDKAFATAMPKTHKFIVDLLHISHLPREDNHATTD
jgi:hypothetical protein